MAVKKHLLLTIRGDYTVSQLAAEGWQCNLRLALVFGGVDPIGALPSNWDPVAATISRTETNWTIDGNWKCSAGGVPVFNPDDYLNDQAAPSVLAWMNTTNLSSYVRVRSLKLYPIGEGGLAVPAVPYASGTPCTLTWTGTYPVGPSAANILPLQNAAVVSHRTGQIGPKGRGRMYRPGLTASAVDGLSAIVSATQTSLRDRQKALLEGLRFTGVGLGQPQVRSIVTGGAFTDYATITTVRVGSVPDTQRRRRRSLPETYVTAAVSP